VITDEDTYYEADTQQLYRDADKDHISDAYLRAHAVTEQMATHGVPYHCFIAVNMTTELGVDYRGTRAPRFWYETPVSLPGDGDALVPTYSSSFCQSLGPLTYQAFSGANHVSLLDHPPFLDVLLDICTA